MKRLIVLTLAATLLALMSGCSILRQHDAQSCDSTSSITSKLSRLRLRNVLPWRSAKTTDCTCNEGFREVGYGGTVGHTSAPIEGQTYEGQVFEGQVVPSTSYDGQIYEGQILEGQIIDDGYSSNSYLNGQISPESLYNADIVGPIVESTPIESPSITPIATNPIELASPIETRELLPTPPPAVARPVSYP